MKKIRRSVVLLEKKFGQVFRQPKIYG